MAISQQFKVQLRKNIYEFEHNKAYNLFTTSIAIAVALMGLAITFSTSVYFGFLLAGATVFSLIAKGQKEKSNFLTRKVKELIQATDPTFNIEQEMRDSAL